MTIQLTPELEARIQAMVDGGAYLSAEEALDAAVAAVEVAAVPDFDDAGELTRLLSLGLESKQMPESEFWKLVDRDADAMLAK